MSDYAHLIDDTVPRAFGREANNSKTSMNKKRLEIRKQTCEYICRTCGKAFCVIPLRQAVGVQKLTNFAGRPSLTHACQASTPHASNQTRHHLAGV